MQERRKDNVKIKVISLKKRYLYSTVFLLTLNAASLAFLILAMALILDEKKYYRTNTGAEFRKFCKYNYYNHNFWGR